MKTSRIIRIILVIIILSVVFLVRFSHEDSWICTETGWVQHGKPNSAKPTVPCGKVEEKQVVEKYLRDNISNLSPEKEVLGGKFYITKIDWVENNSGIVEYEDGHIALKASFDCEIQTNAKNDSYSVVINNFKII